MKALVVYGTKSGCTRGIAEQVGRTLVDRGFSAEVVAAEKAGDPGGFDAVFVGSGVRAGNWHGAAKKWVERHAEVLAGRPVAFFTCGLSPTDPDKREEALGYTAPLVEATAVTPLDTGTFAGWNVPEAFPFVERTVLKLMKAPEGDFRDMDAVAEWTASVASVMEAQR